MFILRVFLYNGSLFIGSSDREKAKDKDNDLYFFLALLYEFEQIWASRIFDVKDLVALIVGYYYLF